ncbi:MAG: hypothetical protein ACRD2L_09790 [Terriglobia bacterium]
MLPPLAFDALVHVCKDLAHIIRMRRRILAVGKSRGALIDLHGTGLPVLQQTMQAARVLKHRLAAAGAQEQQPHNDPTTRPS